MLPSARAWAMDDFPGTRALGMGDTGRAYAVGDAGPMLNPSGMSLVKNFQVLEGSYGYSSRLHAHTLHASMVDNTSGFGIAGGLYYNYHAGRAGRRRQRPRARGGPGAVVPIASRATLGGTVKYFNLSGIDAPGGHTGGVTFDVGTTITLLPKLSVAVVGTNLRDLAQQQRDAGGRLRRGGDPDARPGHRRRRLDPVHARQPTRGRKGTSVMVGGDLTLGGKFDVRLGGGYDAATANGYVAAGAVRGVGDRRHRRGHPSGHPRTRECRRARTVVAISLRLFIPAQQPSLQSIGNLMTATLSETAWRPHCAGGGPDPPGRRQAPRRRARRRPSGSPAPAPARWVSGRLTR